MHDTEVVVQSQMLLPVAKVTNCKVMILQLMRGVVLALVQSKMKHQVQRWR